MNIAAPSLHERVSTHPTLGSKCRFDQAGRAYAEVDGRRIGSVTVDILEVHGVPHERSASGSGHVHGVGGVGGGGRLDDMSTVAERAYHGAIALPPVEALAVEAVQPANAATNAQWHGHTREGADARLSLLPDVLDHLDDAVLIDADRVLRAVHAVNFFLAGRSPLLFLPVHDRLLKSIRYDHGKHFAQLLISLGLSPARIVIEIPPASAAHKTFLGYLLRSYRSYGFKVAAYLEDAGKVLTLDSTAMPDFVIAHAHSALRDGVVRPLVRFGALTKVRVVFAGADGADERDRLTAMGATYIENSL